MRHRWTGWQGDALIIEAPQHQQITVKARATVLALGGASWPRLGSDGSWVARLREVGVPVQDLKPANCGFDVLGRDGEGWTRHFKDKFAGQALKSVAIKVPQWGAGPARFERKGEFVVTQSGIEGSLVYAASALLRDDLLTQGSAQLWLDLLPDKSSDLVLSAVKWPRGSRSLSSHLKSRLGLDGVKMGLLYELCAPETFLELEELAGFIKKLPLPLKAARPLDEAISTAGGVALECLTSGLMLQNLPDVYCAGEMLDWEAPTGGYLLTACLASGQKAGQAVWEKIFKKT
jgi:hypothetical protein